MINTTRKNRGEKPGTLVLLLILSLGLFLRFYDINGESLWLDEGNFIIKAQRSLESLIFDLSLRIHHSPLYFIVLHYWIQLFGDSVIITRTLSAIFGFIAILLIYRLASFMFGKNTGLLTSFILAISSFHISYSQEVKGYSLMVLLTLLSMFFFIQLFQKVNLKIVLGYTIASILLLYTHYYGFFILFVQNFYFLTWVIFARNAQKLNFIKWITLQGILFFLYVPWVWLLTRYTFKVQKMDVAGSLSIPIIRPSDSWFTHIRGRTISELPTPSFDSVIHTFIEFAGSYALLWLFLFLSLISFFVIKKTAGIINKKNLFISIERSKWNVKLSSLCQNYLLSIWIIIPVFLPLTVSFLFKPIYATRYTIAASLPLYILSAHGILRFGNRYLKTSIIIIIVILSIWNIKTYYTKTDKQQWREVAQYIDNNAKYGETLFFLPGYTKKIVFDYYSKRTDLQKIPLPSPPLERKSLELFIDDELLYFIDDYKYFWLIVSFKKDPQGYIRSSLQSFGYKIKNSKKFDGNLSLPDWKIIDVFLFEKNAS
jgi:uncharacterized membrane protein